MRWQVSVGIGAESWEATSPTIPTRDESFCLSYLEVLTAMTYQRHFSPNTDVQLPNFEFTS